MAAKSSQLIRVEGPIYKSGRHPYNAELQTELVLSERA